LSLLNSSEVMPFLTLTAVFLFISPVLYIGITTIWSNIKQKISDELSTRVTRIVNAKNNIPEIENIFNKLTAKINTKIINKLSAHLSELILLSLQSSAKIIINLLQKSLKSIHVMLAMFLKRRNFY